MRLMSVQGQYPTSFAFPDTKLFYRPAQTRQRPALPPANHCPARAVGVELDFLSDKKSTGWPSRADIVDRAGGSDNAESVDGSFMGFFDLVRRTSGVMPFGRKWPDSDLSDRRESVRSWG
jgi:hypothetical protein